MNTSHAWKCTKPGGRKQTSGYYVSSNVHGFNYDDFKSLLLLIWHWAQQFYAAHNDLMAAAITESNLMVDDSDELSSKIFTAFPSFQESHSLLSPSQLKEDLCRAVAWLLTCKQMLKKKERKEKPEWASKPRPLIIVIFTADTCAGAGLSGCMCVRAYWS